MLAGRSSLRGLRQWSRLGEQCTVFPACRYRAVPLPVPRVCGWVPSFSVVCWSRGQARDGRGARCSDTRVLA